MYNDKGNTKYLKLLKQNYSSSQDVIRETPAIPAWKLRFKALRRIITEKTFFQFFQFLPAAFLCNFRDPGKEFIRTCTILSLEVWKIFGTHLQNILENSSRTTSLSVTKVPGYDGKMNRYPQE